EEDLALAGADTPECRGTAPVPALLPAQLLEPGEALHDVRDVEDRRQPFRMHDRLLPARGKCGVGACLIRGGRVPSDGLFAPGSEDRSRGERHLSLSFAPRTGGSLRDQRIARRANGDDAVFRLCHRGTATGRTY